MNNKNPLYITIALIIGLIIGSCITQSFASIKSMRTIPERIEYMEKHKKGLTLKQLDERVTKLERDVKEIKRGKLISSEDYEAKFTFCDKL